jgi:hypothetical protein
VRGRLGAISRSIRGWRITSAAHGGDCGKAFWTFALAVGVEGFAYALASIVLITYMSTLASVEYQSLRNFDISK